MKIGICCIVKQENLYLRDWVKYYYDMGVDKIVLYDNNDVNGEYPQQVIGDYISKGFVDYKNARGLYRHQVNAYNECYTEYRHYFDWIGFLDIDEYWYLSPHLTFDEFFSEERFPNAVGLFLNWLCYGDDNKLHYEPLPVQERFKIPSQPIDSVPNAVKKCFVRCSDEFNIIMNDANGYNVEFLVDKDFHTYTEDGDIFRDEIKRTYQDSYIKHYRTLTIEEFLYRRFGRGGYADYGSPYRADCIMKIFWEQNEWTEEKQNIIDKFFEQFEMKDDVPDTCIYF